MGATRTIRAMEVCLVGVAFLCVQSAAVSDDAYEPNNSQAAAYTIPTTGWLSTFNGFGVQSDDDWFTVSSVPHSYIVVECRFRHEAGNIDLEVIDNGTLNTYTSSGIGDQERVGFLTTPGGSITVHIKGANRGSAYDFWVGGLTLGSDDIYEPNNTLANAFDLSSEEDVWLSQTLPAVLGVQADDDWFKITVPAGRERVIVECLYTYANGDIDLDLADSTGTTIDSSANKIDSERIDYAVATAGTYYVVVSGEDKGNPYDLRWKSIPPDDDAYERNNSLFEAWSPPAGWAAQPLSAIQGKGRLYDEDWYEIEVPTDNLRVQVNCRFSHAAGDIALQLYDASFTPLLMADTQADYEFIDTTVPAPGMYYIRVFHPVAGGQPPGNEYDLIWVASREKYTYKFDANTQGWTWFEETGWPSPLHPWTSGSLEMTQTAGQSFCFGSWESPKNPLNAIHPQFNSIIRAKFRLRGSVSGAICPGFRFRALATHVVPGGPPFDPDFGNPDFNASHEMYYSTVNTLHIAGREPDTTVGSDYTVAYYPVQTPTLMDGDVVVYFSCDLLDLDSWETDAGTLSVDNVEVDAFYRPPRGAGTQIAALSFSDFSSWTVDKKALAGGTYNDAGLSIARDSSEVRVTVANTSEWFEAFAVSPAAALQANELIRTIFTITSTEDGMGDLGPTVRAGFASSKFVFSATNTLPGGSSLARFGPVSRDFEICTVTPTEDPSTPNLTEPMSIRLQSYLTENTAAWPFNKQVSGTIRCTEVFTDYIGP